MKIFSINSTMDPISLQDLIKQIKRYQHCIQQINPVESDSHRVLHCIRKLSKLPIRLEELEKTGIGKTVNALRKSEGSIAEEATLLVAKWKSIVKKQVEEEEASEQRSDVENNDQSDNDSRNASSPMNNFANDVAPEPVVLHYEECLTKRPKDDDIKSKYESSSSKNKVHLITIKNEGSHDRKRKHSEEEKDRSSKKEKYKKVDEHSEVAIHKHQEVIKRESFGSPMNKDAGLVECEESNGDKKKKDRQNERKLHKKEHEKRHHKSSKHREEKSHRESKHHRDDRDKHRSHHDKKHESDDKYNSHKHKREKKSKVRDKDENSSKRIEKDKKSSIESSDNEVNSKNSSSRDVNSYKNDDSGGDDFGAALLGIPMAASPKRKSTSSKSSNYQDSPPTFSSPKSNHSIDFLSSNVKLEPLSKDLDIFDVPDYVPETYRSSSKLSASKHDEHISPSCYSPQSKPIQPKGLSEEDMFSSIAKMKNRRTKVYHGFKVTSKFPTLFELCVRVLQDNFDALEYTGGVPFEVLKPILEKVSVEQLYTFENYNPYLIGETDELWEHHAKKHFRKAELQEYETWRDLYLRCVEEREEKLQSLTENISQSMANSTPVRKTKLAFVDAFVKPPRNVARQQAKHGTGTSTGSGGSISVKRSPKDPQPSPSAVQSVKERLAKEASSPNAIQIPSKAVKKKAAPLMQKTLQLFKGLKR